MTDAMQVMFVNGQSINIPVEKIKQMQLTLAADENASLDILVSSLNNVFGYTWSWEVIEFITHSNVFTCHGRLIIPGIGIKDGIGYDTDIDCAFNKALKNAISMIGVAIPIQSVSSEVASTTDESNKETPSAPVKPQVQSQKQVPTTVQEKAAELKEAYGIRTKTQFVAFAQIWNPEITDFAQITPDIIEQLHTYVEENSVEFEDFQASDY